MPARIMARKSSASPALIISSPRGYLTGSFYGAPGSLGFPLILGMVVLYACLRETAPAGSMMPV